MKYLIEIYTGAYKEHNIPNYENYISLIDNSKLLDYLNRLKIINDSPDSMYYSTRDYHHYNNLMKLHLSKTAPYYDPHKAVEAGRSALNSSTEYKCLFAIDLCKIYNNKELPVYNPTQCIKTLEQYNQASKASPNDYSYNFCASEQMSILSEMFKTGNGVPVNPEKAALLEKNSKEFKATSENLLNNKLAAIDAEHQASEKRRRQQEADEFLSILGTVVGAVAPVIASGGNYIPPPSTYSSGSSGNASDNVNAALNAVITGMGGTSSSSGYPGGGIDTGTGAYNNYPPSGNNTSANNSSQQSGQGTPSRRVPNGQKADPRCFKHTQDGHTINTCNYAIERTWVCLPCEHPTRNDYPHPGTYSNACQGSWTWGPGHREGDVNRDMCLKRGGHFIIMPCKKAKDGVLGSAYALDPEFKTYGCFE